MAARRNVLLISVDRRGDTKVHLNLERNCVLQRQHGKSGSNSRRSKVLRQFSMVYINRIFTTSRSRRCQRTFFDRDSLTLAGKVP